MIYVLISLILLECYFGYIIINNIHSKYTIKDLKKLIVLVNEGKDFDRFGCLACKDGKFYLFSSEIKKEVMLTILDELISFYKKRGLKWI